MEGGGVGDVYGPSRGLGRIDNYLESSMVRLGETPGLDLGPNFK